MYLPSHSHPSGFPALVLLAEAAGCAAGFVALTIADSQKWRADQGSEGEPYSDLGGAAAHLGEPIVHTSALPYVQLKICSELTFSKQSKNLSIVIPQ